MSKVYILDLDNTIYKTWETLIDRKPGLLFRINVFQEIKRLLFLRKYTKLLELMKARQSKHKIVILSARNKYLYLPTLLKLTKDFNMLKVRLILVPRASDKISIIEHIITANRTSRVVVIDDLEYNHENGEPKKYGAVIHAINKLNCTLITGKRLRMLQ